MAMTNFFRGTTTSGMKRDREGICGIAGLRNFKQDKGDGRGWPVDQKSDHCNFWCSVNYTIGRHRYSTGKEDKCP